MKLIKEIESRRNSKGRLNKWAEFLCEISNCGKIVEMRLDVGKKAKSCSSHKNIKHGGKGTKLYRVWHNMKQRILNPNDKFFKDYGGRGITVCNEWLEFTPFRDWALVNGYTEGLVFDRENPDGNYETSNCRFITVLESLRNRTNTITIQIANEIRDLYKTGNYTQQKLAEKYNASQATISLIINNKIWMD